MPGGQDIPMLGLGTFDLRDRPGTEAILSALGLGYRHIDTAASYGNQEAIGVALKETEVPREDLFVTSKVGRENLRYDDFLKSYEQTLAELQLDYLDLLLIHWPNNDIPLAETFRAMKKLLDDDKVKNVGVSNFTVSRMKQALSAADIPIATNQVEYHPYLNQEELRTFCHDNDIPLTAYSPIAKGEIFSDSLLKAIAQDHGKSVAQVALRWLVQKGIIAIPKASSEAHMRDNIAIFDWSLSGDEMARIDGIPTTKRLINYWPGEFDKG
jgi:diketogulonate reductase-like aldo/keto reductase